MMCTRNMSYRSADVRSGIEVRRGLEARPRLELSARYVHLFLVVRVGDVLIRYTQH